MGQNNTGMTAPHRQTSNASLEQFRGGYNLMQETNGHYERLPLDATDDREARYLAQAWHSEHRGQTVVSRREGDGGVNIIATLGW